MNEKDIDGECIASSIDEWEVQKAITLVKAKGVSWDLGSAWFLRLAR